MLRILGEKGRITIQNEQGEMIQELTKDSQQDENGNIIINYIDKAIKGIKVLTTKPVQLGEIKLYHKKVIDANTGYEKQEIEKFQQLENTIKANESINTLQMNLLNTKSETTMHINQNELSTLQKNENVQIMVNLYRQL